MNTKSPILFLFLLFVIGFLSLIIAINTRTSLYKEKEDMVLKPGGLSSLLNYSQERFQNAVSSAQEQTRNQAGKIGLTSLGAGEPIKLTKPTK